MNTIVIAMLALGLSAQAQTRTLTTADGTTYTGITTQRICPDGVYIEYTLPGGGLGVSKVKFNRLSRAQQKQYGFDAATAYDYEAEVAIANENCRQELIQRDQAGKDARRQRDLENEQAYPARMAAIKQLNAAQAALELNFGGPPVGDGHPGNGTGYVSQFAVGGKSSTQTSFMPVTPDLFPNRNITVRSH